jgi:hypothetical protein
MRRAWFVLASGLVVATGVRAAALDSGRAGLAPPSTRASQADEGTRPRGLPANQWRYQFHAGRWWYRTANDGWSYFDGTRWQSYAARRGYEHRPVDLALLRLEGKEGAMGYHRWPHVRGGVAGGSLPISGTQGSLGGSPSGSFTDPVGVPSAVNTATGTSTDVGGLSGRVFSGGRQ